MKHERQSKANRIEPLLRVTKFSKRYVQQRTFSHTEFTVSAFEDVDLTLFRGKTLALVGESGAGKSSLARCIALLERPSTGKMELEGADLLALNRNALYRVRRRMQMIFQDPTFGFESRIECVRNRHGAARDSTRGNEVAKARTSAAIDGASWPGPKLGAKTAA